MKGIRSSFSKFYKKFRHSFFDDIGKDQFNLRRYDIPPGISAKVPPPFYPPQFKETKSQQLKQDKMFQRNEFLFKDSGLTSPVEEKWPFDPQNLSAFLRQPFVLEKGKPERLHGLPPSEPLEKPIDINEFGRVRNDDEYNAK